MYVYVEHTFLNEQYVQYCREEQLYSINLFLDELCPRRRARIRAEGLDEVRVLESGQRWQYAIESNGVILPELCEQRLQQRHLKRVAVRLAYTKQKSPDHEFTNTSTMNYE